MAQPLALVVRADGDGVTTALFGRKSRVEEVGAARDEAGNSVKLSTAEKTELLSTGLMNSWEKENMGQMSVIADALCAVHRVKHVAVVADKGDFTLLGLTCSPNRAEKKLRDLIAYFHRELEEEVSTKGE
jgi:hypothetical protein